MAAPTSNGRFAKRISELKRTIPFRVRLSVCHPLETFLALLITRAHSGIRAPFGPNSSQYEEAGGVRKSERKRPARKATG